MTFAHFEVDGSRNFGSGYVSQNSRFYHVLSVSVVPSVSVESVELHDDEEVQQVVSLDSRFGRDAVLFGGKQSTLVLGPLTEARPATLARAHRRKYLLRRRHVKLGKCEI